MTERILSQVQAVEMGFLQSSRWKTSRQSAQLRNSQSPECRTTSPPNREIPATLVRPCVQNVPGKSGETRPAGYTPGKAVKRTPKGQVEWLHLRPCLVPSWCGASKTIWDCCWSWGISSPPRAAAPATLLRGKAGMKMNESMDFLFHSSFSWMLRSLEACLSQVSAF